MLLQLVILFLLLLLSAYVYYRYAIKTNILDTPSKRSSHTIPTVRGGGIVFFLAVILFFIMQQKIAYPYFFTGFLLLSILGFIDDKKTLSAKLRFPFQLVAIALILYDAGLFENNLSLLIKIVGFITAVGFINAFNFMDGINGITGFYTASIVFPLLYININYDIFPQEWFWVILVAIIVFGFFNFRKNALMFAGDIGSMALASLLLFWLTKIMVELQSPILLALVVIYGVDSAWTIMYRLRNKENIFEAHRWHLYQKFVDDWHFSHLKVAILYSGVQLLISFISLQFIQYSIKVQLFVTIVIYLLFSGIYFFAQKYFKKKKRNLL